MATNVSANGSTTLVISELVPAAGTYTLNGVAQAAVANQVLEWTAPAASLVNGSTMTFTSTAVQSGSTLYAGGPIGFSAVPEPASFGVLGVAALGLLARRRGRA